MKTVNLWEFLKNFPYWKTFKQQMYFIINPVAHFRYAKEEIERMKREDEKYKKKEENK